MRVELASLVQVLDLYICSGISLLETGNNINRSGQKERRSVGVLRWEI